MATDKKFITTKIGTVGAYPWIQKPDTKFNDRGEYRIKFILSAQKAAPIIAAIDEEHAKNMAKLKAKFAGKRIKEGDMPYFEDDNGNFVFTFKSYASYKDKDSGEMKTLTLRVYDSKGGRIMDVPAISEGSEGRVEFSMFAYAPSGAVGASVKLQLCKFQLLKLVEWQGNNDTFGSDDDEEDYEGGYVAVQKPKDEFVAPSEEEPEFDEYDDVDF